MTPATGPSVYNDYRTYNFPADGKIRFIDRKVNRQIQRKRIEMKPGATPQDEKKGFFRKLFGRNKE